MLRVLFLSVLATSSSVALACGGFAHEGGKLAEAASEEVILERDGGSVMVSYRVEYTGDAESFGWLIPVPGTFESLVETDRARFDALRELTAPDWYELSSDSSGGGGGCGCMDTMALKGDMAEDTGGANSAGLGVEVLAEGYSGEFAYSALEVTSAEDLQTWLTERGWSLGDFSTVEDYVAEGGFQWVALEMAPDSAETPDLGRELPAVQIRYTGERMLFPARMARSSENNEQHTRIFVVGDQGARLSGWGLEESFRGEGPSGSDPAAVYEELLVQAGGSGSYVAVAAVEDQGMVISRFETIAPTIQHRADVSFEFSPEVGTGQRFTIELDEGIHEVSFSWLLLGLPLGAWGLRRRRG
jgi:Uncharacterized protein conserved in bacteria (DUF2330)